MSTSATYTFIGDHENSTVTLFANMDGHEKGSAARFYNMISSRLRHIRPEDEYLRIKLMEPAKKGGWAAHFIRGNDDVEFQDDDSITSYHYTLYPDATLVVEYGYGEQKDEIDRCYVGEYINQHFNHKIGWVDSKHGRICGNIEQAMHMKSVYNHVASAYNDDSAREAARDWQQVIESIRSSTCSFTITKYPIQR